MTNPQSHVAVIDVGPAIRFDASASPILYLGTAPAGSLETDGVWAIQRFDVTVGVKGTWANGSAGQENIWTARASLSYS